jgi:LPS O-antigen subunit length determinant protein (WzzB/FepE family)
MKEKNKVIIIEDKIDLVALLKRFWIARKTIQKITLFFVFLGLFIAIFSKNEFTSTTTFVAVNQESVKGSLGGLASLAGINLGGSTSSAEISPELYPQIINSTPFQLELLNTLLTIEGEERSVTYKEFYKNIYSPGLLGNIIKYTIGLPGVLISFLKEGKELDKASQESEIIIISQKENELIKQLKSQMNLKVNDKEGFVTISVTLPEAIASAQITLKARELLQDYILKFKTQKSIEQLMYIQARFSEKQNEFNSVKIALARFQDQNNGINTALGRTKLLQLQADYDLVFSLYSELAKQLEAQRLQVKKDTPLFSILKPVSIPVEKSNTSRAIILVVYLFFGFVFSLGYILGKEYVAVFKKEWTL